MKKSIFALAAAGLLLSSGIGALAQTVGLGVTVTPEERTRIKEYVVKEKVAPVVVKEQLRVGAKLPADVEIRTVPSQWGPNYAKYRYVYHDNHVYFVEPSTREVVTVIE